MRIRIGSSEDVFAMRALEAEAPTAGHWTEEQYRALFRGDTRRLALVVEEERQVAGFLVALQTGPEWEIENLVVGEARRRHGLGAALLHHFLEIAGERGGESVFLEVRASNAAARALYAKFGFGESGRRREYYREPVEDAVVYRKEVVRSQ